MGLVKLLPQKAPLHTAYTEHLVVSWRNWAIIPTAKDKDSYEYVEQQNELEMGFNEVEEVRMPPEQKHEY